MHLGDTGRKRIAVIGMPRSGTTIVASYLNSMDASIVVGEPHLAFEMPRHPKNKWPTIISTRYGDLVLSIHGPVYHEINEFARENNLQIVGFKECWTPWTDPIEIVKKYIGDLDHIFVVIRDPRKNYMSMCRATPVGHQSTSSFKFLEEFSKLCSYVREEPKAEPIFLDHFRISPKDEIEDATGWLLLGDHKFKLYSGGGDIDARTAKFVKRVDTMEPSSGDEHMHAMEIYDNMISFKILDRIVHGKRLFI